MVIGTRTSSTEVKTEAGMVNGGAVNVLPAGGGGRGYGSGLGGNWKSEESGMERRIP